MTQAIKEVTQNLRKLFDDEVNRSGDLIIEDFVENHFIPGLKSIQESQSITKAHSKEISAMILGISTEKNIYLKLNGLGVKEGEDASKLLKLHIDEHLDRIDKIFDSITLTLGKNVTSMVALAEEVPRSELTVLGGQDYPLGPGGHYYIKRASDRWQTRNTTATKVLGEILGTRDSSGIENIFGGIPTRQELLAITSKNAIPIKPIIGKSLINGRKVLSVLEIAQPVSLLIVPVDKYQPPHFFKVPMRQHFLTYVNREKDVAMMIIHTIREGINRSGKPYIVAELSKTVENVVVSDREVKKITVHEKIFGYEGILKDFLIAIVYQQIHGREESELERDLRELTELVDSFHPVTFLDPSEKIHEIEQTAEEDFNEYHIQTGYEIFVTQFFILIGNISALKPDDPADRLKIMQLLEPLETLGSELKIQENKQWKKEFGKDTWDLIWDSFHRAEKGDAKDFIELINEMKEGYESMPMPRK